MHRTQRSISTQVARALKKSFAKHLLPPDLAALTHLPALSKADSDIAKRLVSLLPQQAPSVASMRLVKQLEAQGAYPWLLQVAQSNHETRLEAITSLLDLQQQPLLTQALGSQDLDKAQATGIALAQAQRPDAFASKKRVKKPVP